MTTLTHPAAYSLGLEEGYSAFRRTGLPIPPDGGWAAPLLAYLGADGLRFYLGLDEGASREDVRLALLEYARGCDDGLVDAQKDRAVE